MWTVYEHHSLKKKLNKLPKEILKRYEKWKDIVSFSGLEGLRAIKGFHDESLQGKWQGYRSSRLSQQYPVIYFVQNDEVCVRVFDVNAHDYRKR